MKKVIALVIVLGLASLSNAALSWNAPAQAAPGETLTLTLSSDLAVSSIIIGSLSDSGVAPGYADPTTAAVYAPLAWSVGAPYNGGAIGMGDAGDLVAISASAGTNSKTGDIFSYSYTMPIDIQPSDIIFITAEPLPTVGYDAKVVLLDGTVQLIPEIAIHVIPEPMTLGLLAIGGLVALRRRR